MSDQTHVVHTVVVYFRLAGNDLTPLYAVEEVLTTAISAAGAGEYDGHEVALLDTDDAYLFMLGPDAEKLFEAARPVLEASPLLRGAQVTLRFGDLDDEDAPERAFVLGER